MSSILTIYAGMKNYISGDDLPKEIIEMAERRARICSQCEYLQYSTVHKAAEWVLNQIGTAPKVASAQELSGYKCSLCNCVFRIKILAPDSVCPFLPSKWKAETIKPEYP